MRLRLTFLGLMLLTVQLVAAQTLDVSGTVRDSHGEPIIGATVALKGGSVKALTDTEGKFTVKDVKTSDVLVISYLGMQQQHVKAKHNLNVTMYEDYNQLDDVMVVAFGKQKKSSFTGSATVIGAKELEKKQVTNALSALNGEVAGVQLIDNSGDPASSPIVRIRGFSSINAGNDPLIILDGAPYDGGINNINPNDIASVSVMKDAASNALYGARGANGVIMITTKSAAKGENKTTITLDTKWGVNSNAAVEYDCIDNAGEYYEMYYKALKNSYLNSGKSSYEAHVQANEALYKSGANGGLGYVVYTVPNNEYLIGTNGKLNPNHTLGYKVTNGDNTYMLIPDDWSDEAYRNAFRQEYNLSVSSSLKNAQVYASLGYLDNEGIVYNSSYERYTGRIKTDWQANKWLSLGANVSYAHSKREYIDDTSSSSLFYVLKEMAPIYPLYIRDANGNIMTDSNGKMYDYGDGVTLGTDYQRQVFSTYNPLQESELNTNETIYNNFTLSGFVDITPLEGLKITLNGTVTNNQSRSTYSYQPFYGWSYNNYPYGAVSKNQTQTYSVNFQQLVNYTKDFGLHNIGLLFGHENYKYRYDYLYGMKKDMASFFGNQNLSGAITLVETGDYNSSSPTTDYSNEGWFFRALYDYDSIYFASASFRRDGSSRFHPAHRWGNFFSLGGAWMMSKEGWFKAAWVDQLKLKASIGQQGNDNIGEFRYTDLYTVANNNGEIGITWASKGNEDITWETNTNLNVGVDFSLWKGRLTGSVEYFYRHTTDMLSWVTAPYEVGYSGYYDNIGSMDNKGVEINLDGTIIRNRNFSWSMNLNATHYKNEVTELASDRKNNTVQGYQGYVPSYNQYIGEGLPIYTWCTKKYAGVDDNGKATWYVMDDDGNTVSTTNDYTSASDYLCGDAIPDLYGGFGTRLSAYGFDFSVSFTYSIGGKMYDTMYQILTNNPTSKNVGYNIHKDVYKAWSETNTVTSVPRYVYNEDTSTYYSSRFLVNASYLALQNINIGYTLPARWVRRLGLSSIRIYGSADNLCYWSKRKGFDPRGQFAVDYSGTSTADYTYSPMRSISGGINIQF